MRPVIHHYCYFISPRQPSRAREGLHSTTIFTTAPMRRNKEKST